MKTPLQELIERFENGAKMHQQQMNEGSSPTEKNRESYLYGHCKAVIAIATELLEKEKQTIVDAYNTPYDLMTSNKKVITAEQYYNKTFKTK